MLQIYSLKKTQALGRPRWDRPENLKFIEIRVEKTVKKWHPPKTTFFPDFEAFRPPWRRYSMDFGVKTESRSIDFRDFLANHGFPEIAPTMGK